MPRKNDEAPDFSGLLADGSKLRLRDFRGKRNVVLYFFPMDFTPGCTKEACTFRDRRADLAKLDAEVIGVSTDSAEKHGRFATAYNLPYPLVSDRDASISSAYGVQRLGGWLPSKRVTFVIGKDGIIHDIIRSELAIERHIDEAIDTLTRLEKKS